MTKILVYADDNATKFFCKHGFSKELTLPKAVFWHHIEHFTAATLMECRVFPHVDYPQLKQILNSQMESLLQNIVGAALVSDDINKQLLSSTEVKDSPPSQGYFMRLPHDALETKIQQFQQVRGLKHRQCCQLYAGIYYFLFF